MITLPVSPAPLLLHFYATVALCVVWIARGKVVSRYAGSLPVDKSVLHGETFAEVKRDAQAGTYECVSSDQIFANIPEQIQT